VGEEVEGETDWGPEIGDCETGVILGLAVVNWVGVKVGRQMGFFEVGKEVFEGKTDELSVGPKVGVSIGVMVGVCDG